MSNSWIAVLQIAVVGLVGFFAVIGLMVGAIKLLMALCSDQKPAVKKEEALVVLPLPSGVKERPEALSVGRRVFVAFPLLKSVAGATCRWPRGVGQMGAFARRRISETWLAAAQSDFCHESLYWVGRRREMAQHWDATIH